MKRTSCTAWVALAGSLLLVSPPAAADADPDPRSAAQRLFYEARTLMKDGKYDLACPKLEESLHLDHGIGTAFNLADCNEKRGRIASAWQGFVDAATAATALGQPQRERIARERAKALEARLPKLRIVLAQPIPDMQIARDDTLVASASLGIDVPVDPGPHQVTASAPGRQSWQSSVVVIEGSTSALTIPDLVPIAAAPATQTLAQVAAQALPLALPKVAEPTPAEPAAPNEAFPEPIIEPNQTQRRAAWVVGAAGLVGVGVGAWFGVDSWRQRERAKSHCFGNSCDATGVELRDKAIASGTVATVAMIAGAAVLASGLVLLLTAPRAPSRKESMSRGYRSSPHWFPNVAINERGGGLTVEGLFP